MYGRHIGRILSRSIYFVTIIHYIISIRNTHANATLWFTTQSRILGLSILENLETSGKLGLLDLLKSVKTQLEKRQGVLMTIGWIGDEWHIENG